MKPEAEIGGMHLQAKEHQGLQQPPKSRREAWSGSFLRVSRRSQAFRHFDFRLLASRTVSEHVSVLNHLFVAIC